MEYRFRWSQYNSIAIGYRLKLNAMIVQVHLIDMEWNPCQHKMRLTIRLVVKDNKAAKTLT